MLDQYQQKIVNATENKIIVEAGAGSGKTKTLIERIKKLLKDGVEPSNIVCITFTRMAAEELKERLIDVPGIGDCFVGTIHAFANKIFKNSGEEYKLFTEEIENQFMNVLISIYGKFLTMDRYLVYKDLQKKIDLGILDDKEARNSMSPSEMYEIDTFMGENVDEKYPENIKTLCKKHHIINFDELLKKTTAYFKEIGGKVEYLFVDEFQDIGPLEKKFFQALNADNYFYVGDEKQALYAFKGGNVSYFLNLIKNPDWKAYYLKNNYRCGQKIIELSQKVICQANDTISIESNCMSNKMGEITIDSKYKLDFYLNKIKNYKDWFILVRTNKDIAKMEIELNKNNIPYITFKKSDMSLDEMKKAMKDDKVKLLTIHASKGLESPNVLMWGNFPIKEKPYLRNNDEIKVRYVGITRTMENLILLN